MPRPRGLEGSTGSGLSPTGAQPWPGTQPRPRAEHKALRALGFTGLRCWSCPAAFLWPVLPSTALNPLALHN